jgi:hypothetical protein
MASAPRKQSENSMVTNFKKFLKEDSWGNEILEKKKKQEDGLKKTQNLHDHLIKHYSKYVGEHEEHLKKYTDDSSGVNTKLWKTHAKKKLSDDEKYTADRHSSPKVEWLDSAMHQHKTPDNLTVYSGTNIDPRKAKNKEGIVHHPAYMSTSIMPHIAREFGDLHKGPDGVHEKHMMMIHVPKGSHGAYVGNPKHSYTPEEREFILPRGTNLRHLESSSHEENHSIYGKVRYHTHEMEVV